MRIYLWIAVLAMMLLVLGCSSGNENSMTSPNPGEKSVSSGEGHQAWGYWQFTADPASGTLDVVPLREASIHLNALVFLEPPVLVNLTLETLFFNGNIIETDIGLRHPFIGLDEFTGFDVCGLFISKGSVSGFEDPDIRMAGPGDTRLLNPDGYTRWWNPAEFPSDGTMFGYKDGLLGVPDSSAGFNSTINGYKLFTDDITLPDDPVSSLDPASRCVFSAGQKNVRHYSIELGVDGLTFNYAVDANWTFPTGNPPWDVPGSFAPQANRVEPWNVSVNEIENTLWNDGTANGGDLSLSVDVWDHYNAGLNTVKVESAGNFISQTAVTPVGGGVGYSTYAIDITDATPSQGSIDIFITVGSEAAGYQGLLPGKTVSAYFIATANVDPDAPTVQGPGKIAWVSNQDGNPEIYRMQGDGTIQTRLTYYGDHDWEPMWSPDGTEITWRRGGYGGANIWVMNEDGTNQHQVTYAGSNFDPDWSPDGIWIYYWSYNGTGAASPRIWRVHSDGSGVEEQVTFLAAPSITSFVVSPDNQYFAAEAGGVPRDIYRIDISGVNPVNLTNSPGSWDAYPTYDSTGSQICYTSDQGGSFKLYIMNSDGTNNNVATSPPPGQSDFMGVFGVNDEKLVVWRRLSGSSNDDEIGLVDLATGDFTQFTYNSAYDQYLDWHPGD